MTWRAPPPMMRPRYAEQDYEAKRHDRAYKQRFAQPCKDVGLLLRLRGGTHVEREVRGEHGETARIDARNQPCSERESKG